MGSPLGPVLANIFMYHFEEKWVSDVVSRPSVLFRYVDDTFSLFDSKDSASRFLHYSRHPNIKFTNGTRRKPRDTIFGCPYQAQAQHFLNMGASQTDLHWSLHQVVLVHS